jgi:hypothetical protein
MATAVRRESSGGPVVKKPKMERSLPPTKLLAALTSEQAQIRQLVLAGRSLRVLANAGSGKTRILLQAASEMTGPILFLAYNRDIKEEVQELVSQHGLDHVTVENYDSLLVNYYDQSAASQDFALSMQAVLEEDRSVLKPFCWKSFFVDEAQDLDENYMRFLEKVLRDNLEPREAVQLVSVGDPKQNIFRYRGADPKYFMTERLHPEETPTLTLSHTFRFGQELCDFIDVVCAPLFPDKYLLHTSSRTLDRRPTVERWVLVPGAPSTALIDRLQDLRTSLEASQELCKPEEKLLTFLTGSKKESNDALWGLVEELSTLPSPREPYYGLVAPDPSLSFGDGLPLAYVRNVHACKGKTFEVAVLFVTTKRSWLASASGDVERETLYVALTRARHLVIVESAASLIFQDILGASLKGPRTVGATALPTPKCANTGAALEEPLERRRPTDATSYSKPSIWEQIQKLEVQTKKRLLQLIDAPAMREWDVAATTSDATRMEELLALAAWIRVERERGEEVSRHQAFIDALRKQTPEKAYSKLWRSRRAHPLAPHLRRKVVSLAEKGSAWAGADYLQAARLHHNFHYGYMALPECTPEEETVFEALSSSLALEFGRLEDPQKISDIRFISRASSRELGSSHPTIEHGLYLLGTAEVVLIRAETVQAERLNDRLMAAYAAGKMGVEEFEVTYVPMDGGRAVCRARGRLLVKDRTDYVDLFERAFEEL